MFKPTKLTLDQMDLCFRTMSSNTFYMLVGDALVSGRNLSVVRMGDGEVQLLKKMDGLDPDGLVDSHDEAWQQRLGTAGITRGELKRRLDLAANECKYFAPSISGIQLEGFHLHSLFEPRQEYVDNFFVNSWTDEMRTQIYQLAKHVLFIHRNPNSANALAMRLKHVLGVKVTFIQMDGWRDAEGVIAQAAEVDAPLVLFSAGPASKYIGHRIATSGRIPKVAIDLGNASDHWLMEKLHSQIPPGSPREIPAA